MKNYSRGKNPNSRRKRQHHINDEFFSTPNELNCYWAGFIAADGNINTKERILTIGLAEKDREHLERLVKDMDSNYSIRDSVSHGHFGVYVTITSEKICKDLKENFSITPRKSLTLLPPKIKDKNLIDSFIIGYIDGDGSIGLYPNKRQKRLQLQFLGTKEVLEWINNRLKEITGRTFSGPYQKNNKNTYTQVLTDRNCREVYKHLYSYNLPKLLRKWKLEYYDHCNTFSKFRNIDTYRKVFSLRKEGHSKSSIARMLGVTSAAIYWIMKQDIYKQLDIETES